VWRKRKFCYCGTLVGVCLYNWVEANLVEEASFFLSCLLRKRRLGSSSYLTLVPRASSTTHTHNFFWDVFFMSSGLVRDSWRVILQPSSLQGSTWSLTSFRLPPAMMCRRWQKRLLLPGESPFRVKPFFSPSNWSMLGWALVVSWSELRQVPLIWLRFGLPIHSGSSSSSHVMARISILYWWWETYIMRERPLLFQFLNCFGSGSSSSHGWAFSFPTPFPIFDFYSVCHLIEMPLLFYEIHVHFNVVQMGLACWIFCSCWFLLAQIELTLLHNW